LELWGGTESTVNRIGERFIDQLELTGHAQRLDDLDRFAALGINAMRYPVLWERTAPDGVESADWSWSDQRLIRLRELGIEPIVGLVHHGSGPPHTSLLDPAFPAGLAEYARAVAARYPWVRRYTPVNEPLTTARFSGLYGHWYPHRADAPSFIRMLLTECRAVVLAMEAVRSVNPSAELVQTDDLGRIFSTAKLAHQAEYENERRWLTFDLLCGRVDAHHPLWPWLLANGAAESDFAWFREHPCPPDIMGINHYLSSDRYLDQHVDRYPEETHGSNGREAYADVLAARVREEGIAGPQHLLQEAWDRYHLPLAITEAHNGCTREEQMRWMVDVWCGAQDARQAGVDVRAVTAWTLLGTVGWSTLVTGEDTYEPGVFDLRSPQPRRTAMVPLLQDLAAGRTPHHPLLSVPGWWQREVRFEYGFAVRDDGSCWRAYPDRPEMATSHACAPLLITGATGTLGQAIARLCEVRGIPYRLFSRPRMDITDPDAVEAVMANLRPWAVVNAAGFVRVDEAEAEAERCYRENAAGPAILAEACARSRARFLTYSSDLVFDGGKNAPYTETDPARPLNAYGRSKHAAEERVLAALPSALIIRSSAFFGPWDPYNFVTLALRELSAGRQFEAAADQVVSPTYVPDLVDASLDLLIDGEAGIWHLTNEGAVTWFELARTAAAMAGADGGRVRVPDARPDSLPAARPRYSVLGSERGQLLPPLEDALERYLQERL
jgi:dTDP-4-dehydrorhamnose reductase